MRRRVWAAAVVACVVGAVVGALFIISATRQNAPPALAKDPADVLLRLSDLPAGFILWVDNQVDRSGSVVAWRQFSFTPPENQEVGLAISVTAERFSETDGAINEYNKLRYILRAYENSLIYYEPALGDNYFWMVGWVNMWSYINYYSGDSNVLENAAGWYVIGVCRKQGFVLTVKGYAPVGQTTSISVLLDYIPLNEFARYLQTMADRTGGENLPHILPPLAPAENKDTSDVVLRQGDLPLYFVENLAERVESQSSSYRTFRTGDAWVTAFVRKFSSEEDAHLFFEDNCGVVYGNNIQLVEVLAPALGEESVLLRAEDVLVGYLWQEYRFKKGDFVVRIESNTTTESFDMVPYAAIMDSRI